MRPGNAHTNHEAALAEQCRRNNAAAQKVVYTRYADDMLLLCLRYVPLKDDAMEVLMDGFLNAFKHIGQFVYRGEGSMKAWLKKIMVNQCLQFLRKRNTLLYASRDIDHIEEITDSGNPLDVMTAKEIMAMVHSLPDGYRTVFNLYVFEEMGHKDIAAALGITENTSKSQLHRARQVLKEKILQHC